MLALLLNGLLLLPGPLPSLAAPAAHERQAGLGEITTLSATAKGSSAREARVRANALLVVQCTMLEGSLLKRSLVVEERGTTIRMEQHCSH